LPEERIFAQLKHAIVTGDPELAVAGTREALNAGIPPLDILIKGFCEGLKVIGVIGEKYRRREYNLVEVVTALDALKAATKFIKPQQKRGTIVIGTVENDPHDIGKDFVAVMLEAIGFDVHDLGLAVSADAFVSKVQEVDADLIAASATTYVALRDQKVIAEKLEKAQIRTKIKYIVGGLSCTPEWAREIEADGYGADALEALKIAEELFKKLKEERSRSQ